MALKNFFHIVFYLPSRFALFHSSLLLAIAQLRVDGTPFSKIRLIQQKPLKRYHCLLIKDGPSKQVTQFILHPLWQMERFVSALMMNTYIVLQPSQDS